MEHALYVITAQVLTSDAGYSGSREIPTFYLDSAVQCITGPLQAMDIAKAIIDPMGILELSVSVECRTLLTPPF